MLHATYFFLWSYRLNTQRFCITRQHINFPRTKDRAPAAASAHKGAFRLPLTSLSDFLSLDLVSAHLDTLSDDQVARVYGPYMPKSFQPTKLSVLALMRDPFFQQTCHKLGDLLKQANGAGYLLAHSLKYEYNGEGIEPFLCGLRKKAMSEPTSSAPE